VDVEAGVDGVVEEVVEDSLALAGVFASADAGALLSEGAESDVPSTLGSELLDA
jgi:hypothetical protein